MICFGYEKHYWGPAIRRFFFVSKSNSIIKNTGLKLVVENGVQHSKVVLKIDYQKIRRKPRNTKSSFVVV